jgi:hypothetical protein
MAMTQQEFIQQSGAELVGGNLIVGSLSARMIVGTTIPVFTLNAAGQQLMADLEAGDTAAEAVEDVQTARQIQANGASAANAPLQAKRAKKSAPAAAPAAETAAPVEPTVAPEQHVMPQDIAAEAARIAADAAKLVTGN